MGQVIQINGDYTIKARRAGGANVMFDTGEQIGSVTVTGDLHVLGTTHTFNSQVISDVVLVLNRGETGTGVTLRRSGLEIDRGSRDRADFLFDEDVNAWTVTHKLTDGTYSYANSNLQVRKILTDASTDNGDLTLINTGTGVVKVAGTNAYETRVLDYTRLASVAITHIERSSTLHMITVTTATPHGLSINDYVDIHCATFPAFNASDKIILDRTDTTFKYADNGATFANTPVSGYVIKNSLMWIDGSSYVPTDDYIPNMRTVSDYSRSLITGAIDNFSTSHIEDQNSSVLVYDSETAGGTSYVKVTVDGIEKIRVIGAGITTPASTFDLLNENATTVNFAGAGTLINVGSGTTGTTTNLKNATVAVGNGLVSAITTPAATFNLVNDTASTVNFAGAGTLINIGSDAVSTTTNLKNATLNVGNGIVSAITTPAATFSLVNTNATTVNFAGAGTLINIGSDAVSTTTNLKNATVKIGNGTVSAITTPATTFNLIDDTATSVNFAGAGTLIDMGANSGTFTVNNPTIATTATSLNLFDTVATTVNFAGAGTLINVGSGTTGTITNLKNAEIKVGNGTVSAITTPATTFNLIDDTATTVNFAGAGTLINVGSATGGTTTNLKNAEVKVGNGTTSSITTPATTFNLVNDTATTVNLAGAGTSINIGSATGGTTTNLKNAVVAIGNGTTSSITTPATTFNLVNSTATTVNFAGAATTISMGSALPGITTINHDLVVTGSLTVNGPASSIGSSSLSVEDPIIYLGNNNPGDSFDLGFVGGYNFGPPGNQNPTHPHTGLVRDASDGIWKLFSGITAEPTTTVDFTTAVYDKLKIGDLSAVKGVFTGDLSAVKGVFTGDVSGVKGTFTGDVSGVKGTFTGNLSTTGNLSAVGGAFTGTVTGITPAMVGVYTKSETDAVATQKATDAATDILSGLESGSVTVNSSVNLSTNASGILPVLNGGTGVGTKTGTGSVVLSTSPTLVTPVLDVATATSINKVTITQPSANATLTLFNGSTLATNGANSLTLKTTIDTIATFPAGDITVGYVDMPQVIQNSQGGPGLTDVGKHWFHTDSGAVTYYIDGNEPFPIGSVLTFINDSGAGDVTITATGTSLVLAGTGFVASLSVKLAADGIATAIKTTTSKWLINGVGLTVV
jgi:hypothetical protein